LEDSENDCQRSAHCGVDSGTAVFGSFFLLILASQESAVDIEKDACLSLCCGPISERFRVYC
jgi:hypothetical protein